MRCCIIEGKKFSILPTVEKGMSCGNATDVDIKTVNSTLLRSLLLSRVLFLLVPICNPNRRKGNYRLVHMCCVGSWKSRYVQDFAGTIIS